MDRLASKFLLAAALLAGWSASAAAYSKLEGGRLGPPIPSATALTDAAPALAPMAFVQFCLSYREQCADAPSANVLTLDAESWANLHQINREVNEAIAPDFDKGGYDWSLETRLGNCNDYAIQKRQALIRLGYPMGALSLAVVRTAFGEGHLVLTVRTDRGDFVLDNRRATIVAWNRTGYRWLKRQSAENPLQWVALAEKPTQPNVQPAAGLPAGAAPALRNDRDAVAMAEMAEAPQASTWATSIPLPSIGLAAERLDAILSGPPTGSGAIGTTTGYVAPGLRLAMLALDDPGRLTP